MKKLLSILKYLLVLSIGIGLLYLAFKGQDIELMLKEIQNVDYSWILLSLVFAFFAHLSRAIRWNMLIKPLGYSPHWFHTFLAVMVAYLTNLAAPRLGEVARCGVIKRLYKAPMNSLIGTVVAERTIDFFTLLLLVVVTILLQFSLLYDFFTNTVILPIHDKIISTIGNLQIVIIALMAMVVTGFIIVYLIRDKISQSNFYQKAKHMLQGFWQGVISVTNMETKWLFLAHTIFIWTMYFLMTYICFYSMGSTTNLTILAGMTVFIMGGLGIAAPVQGGIGTFHWAVSQSLVLYGVTVSNGLIFATLIHASQVLFFLIFGGAAMIIVLVLEKRINMAEKF